MIILPVKSVWSNKTTLGTKSFICQSERCRWDQLWSTSISKNILQYRTVYGHPSRLWVMCGWSELWFWDLCYLHVMERTTDGVDDLIKEYIERGGPHHTTTVQIKLMCWPQWYFGTWGNVQLTSTLLCCQVVCFILMCIFLLLQIPVYVYIAKREVVRLFVSHTRSMYSP